MTASPSPTRSSLTRFGSEWGPERLTPVSVKTCHAIKSSNTWLLGAGSLSPAGVYVAPYTASELKSDGVKCLMKAYVEASDGPSRAEKDSLRSKIDAGFAVKDWHGFVTAISEFADPDVQKVTKAFFEFALAGVERNAEARSFGEALAAAGNQSWRDLSIRYYGELPVVLEEYDQYVQECQYGLAQSSLDRAMAVADSECKALGHNYRIIEQELVSSIYRTWEVMEQDLIGDSPALVILRNQQRAKKAELPEAKAKLLAYVKKFDGLDARQKALEKLTWKFETAQEAYARQLVRTRDALDGPAACYAIEDLRNFLSDKTGACRAAFFRGRLAGPNTSPEAVEQELFPIASQKSAAWWAEVDEIRTLFRTCREGEGFGRIEALRSAIQSNPIILVSEGSCKAVEQPVLLGVLNGFAVLPHCRKTTVPEIVGEPLATAANLLNDAELLIEGKPEEVDPKPGQTPGVVIESDPRPGSTARVWTGVRLTVVGKLSEEDMIVMPEVVGLSETAAVGEVSGVGLTPVVKKGMLANKIEFIPDQIYHASHTKGDKLAPKTEVVLTKYGPRPMVKVPAISGSDLGKAKGILAAAGFVAGDPAAGNPPPDGKEPGEIYGSVPESGSEQEMFTIVQPLVYGLRAQETVAEDATADTGDGEQAAEERPVPSVIGKPPLAAISMLEADDFFVAGSVTPGNPAKENEKPGTVQAAIPAVGSSQPKGTVVNLRIVMPVQGEPGAAEPEPDASSTEPAAEDGGWIGRFRVSGDFKNDKGKVTPIRGIMEIGPEEGMLVLKWLTEKDGAVKQVIKLPVIIGADNVLRVHPKVLEEMENGGSSTGNEGGLLGIETGKLAVMFKEIFKTLEISRHGSQCALSVTDSTNGPQTLVFSCIREGGAPQ